MTIDQYSFIIPKMLNISSWRPVPPDLGGASSRRCHGALRPGHPYDHPLGGYDPL